MSYASVITELKALMRRELLDIDPKDFRAHVEQESDRASIILTGGVIERFLVYHLNERMPGLNSDERAAIFQFEGPCGSFSTRIKMAQALGIINRKQRRQADLIREMRNVAAHAHTSIDFSTPEIRSAVYALCDERHRDLLEAMPPKVLRTQFEALGGMLIRQVVGLTDEDHINRQMEELRKFATGRGLLPSPDKPSQRRPSDRPPKGEKGSRRKPPR